MVYILFVILTFIISAAIGWFSIPRIVIIAKMKRLFDAPDERKVHTGTIPRLGGLSFFPATLFAFAFTLGLRYHYGYNITLDLQGDLMTEFLFVISGMLILYFVGMVDDLVGVGYRSKFLAQIIAAISLVYAGVTINDFQGLLGIHELPYTLDIIITILAVVLTINAFNLIDGVDGLCSGLGTIILSYMGGWFIFMELYVYAMFAFGMVGVLVAFFQYNVLGTRLKVFMGDTGSLTLGYMIIFLAFKFMNFRDVVAVETDMNFSTASIMMGLLFIPLFDTLRVFIMRISRGKSPFHPDKNHIHHKLLQLGLSHLQSTGALLAAQIVFIALNTILAMVVNLNINTILAIDISIAIIVNTLINRTVSKRGRELRDDEVITKNM